MPTIKSLAAIFFAAVINICSVFGQPPTKTYISGKGNDRNAGTRVSPVKSIQKAQKLVRANSRKNEVQVIFADGIYYLPETFILNADDSG
jgi:hypothetical protein